MQYFSYDRVSYDDDTSYRNTFGTTTQANSDYNKENGDSFSQFSGHENSRPIANHGNSAREVSNSGKTTVNNNYDRDYSNSQNVDNGKADNNQGSDFYYQQHHDETSTNNYGDIVGSSNGNSNNHHTVPQRPFNRQTSTTTHYYDSDGRRTTTTNYDFNNRRTTTSSTYRPNREITTKKSTYFQGDLPFLNSDETSVG